MDFHITEEQEHLRQRCRELAADFATRSAEHDREGSHPSENYEILRQEGFCALNVPKRLGGAGHGLLGHTLAFEELAQGCPSTALSFNMHLSITGPLMESDQVTEETKQMVADMVVRDRKLIAGYFSEASSTALIGERPLATRARRVKGGYSLTGRKMFASMLQAADYCAVLTYPDEATNPSAALFVFVPRDAAGRSVAADWDTLGMRATRSDSLTLEECWVAESAAVYRTDDFREMRRDYASWFWASYTPVYLGVGIAAYNALLNVVKDRQPQGYAQPLAYHPDVRRQVAKMSVELEAARLMTYHSAWLSDTEGPTPKTLAALFRAKYMVGEVVGNVTRTALTLGGAHTIFRGGRLEQLFRDGALGALQPPPSDFCLYNVGLYELGLDAMDIVPPLKPL
ncbi:MAG: acyl-CoA/acyl-ACP dehydrogenase [Rhodospirillaceae bacterium]|nr:acyl-CoA/acyl-ACP dehydrogenase [Rhodospirillaceae bacterium]